MNGHNPTRRLGQLHLRMPLELIELCDQVAVRQRRTRTAQVRVWIERGLEEAGVLDADPDALPLTDPGGSEAPP